MSFVPPFAIITGSKMILLQCIFFNAFETDRITFVEWSMPILIASGLISLLENKI